MVLIREVFMEYLRTDTSTILGSGNLNSSSFLSTNVLQVTHFFIVFN